jgi:hypothetical protein
LTKYPSEIFGHPFNADHAQAELGRERRWCPFVDKVCYKKSRLIEYPFGVCSAFVGGSDIALCPRRFLDGHTVFTDIARHHFGGTSDLLVFPEIRLPNAGSFDFVMVKHKPMSTIIEDFVAIEFQTGQTTGTGELVAGLKDFMGGERAFYKSYNFGLNSYDIWKRTFTQVLTKGVIMESWGRKIFWVVQEPIYQDFERRYALHDLGFDEHQTTVFALYDLVRSTNKFDLVATRNTSASIDRLFGAFRTNPNMPQQEDFVAALQSKVAAEAQLSLQLEPPTKPASVDVRPPTATGRLRDSDETDEYH